jgi:hypothetical protein
MISTKSQSKIALTYLLIASILGILLRLFPISDFNANFRFIVHTHSHIALLGWVYIALTTILYKIGIPKEKKEAYKLVFWSTQITIIGMLFSFPFVGYALYSILFSTLFIICTYWFFYFFRKNNSLDKNAISYKFINISLVFMVISSIGPWLLGIIMSTLGSTSHWYKNAIYFYLHFQYNGWFIFCLIGILFYILEKQKFNFSISKAKRLYQIFTISCIFTLFLSFLWIKPSPIIFIIAGIGAVLQLIAFIHFHKLIKDFAQKLKEVFGLFNYRILQFIATLFFIKVLLQLCSATPYFSEITYKYIDFVIGYLHLVFLGIITLTALILLNFLQLIIVPKIWISIFLIGFILSEIFIFYKGGSIWLQINYIEDYFTYLVIISSLLPISILGIYSKNLFMNASTRLKSL